MASVTPTDHTRRAVAGRGAVVKELDRGVVDTGLRRALVITITPTDN